MQMFSMPKYNADYYDILRKYQVKNDRWTDVHDGDWDDIVSPDDYEEILDRKRFEQSNRDW